MDKTLLSPHRKVLKGFTVKVTTSGIQHTFKLTEKQALTHTHTLTMTNEHHGIIGVSYSIK